MLLLLFLVLCCNSTTLICKQRFTNYNRCHFTSSVKLLRKTKIYKIIYYSLNNDHCFMPCMYYIINNNVNLIY